MTSDKKRKLGRRERAKKLATAKIEIWQRRVGEALWPWMACTRKRQRQSGSVHDPHLSIIELAQELDMDFR